MKYNTEIIISKFKNIHGDKFNYSLVDYKNYSTKVKIICDKHGVFEQVPGSHIIGHGCRKCYFEAQSLLKTNITYYRKWDLNENYFTNIDNEEKAYFLGLLYADGSLSNDKSICLSLKDEDKYILEKFKNVIDYKKPLIFSSGVWKVVVNSHIMNNDLIDKGCFMNKTFTLKLPNSDQVPNELFNHFLRGYFDGDGCIHISKTPNQDYINFLGSFDLINGLEQYFNKHGIKSHVRKINKIYSIMFRTDKRIKQIREILYKNSTISLIRKKEKFYGSC